MTLSNKNSDGMKYEPSGTKTLSKGVVKKQLLKAGDQLPTYSLLWLVIKRHKVVLLGVGNVVLILNWAMPQWTELLKAVL